MKKEAQIWIVVGLVAGLALAWPKYQEWSEYQAAEKLVADTLKDPSSAQFRNLKKDKLTGSICGEVNAKNSYGAYTGFKVFQITKGKLSLEQEPDLLASPEVKALTSQLNAALRISCK